MPGKNDKGDKPRSPVPPPTKVHRDKKKERDRKRCRGKVDPDDE